MAGQLGNKTISIQNLEVVSIDEERGLLLVKGGVPGAIGGWVAITDAKKKVLPPHAPFPVGSKKIKNSELTMKDKDDKNEIVENLSKEKKEDNIDDNIKNENRNLGKDGK